jgi:hypothetical protein
VADRRLVAFPRPFRRTLQRPVELAEHAPDVAGMILHARHALDDHRDPRQRPQRRREPECRRALAQGDFHSGELSGRQPWLATSPTRATQRGASVLAPRVIPTHDTLAADAETTGNRPLRLSTRGEQPCRLLPTIFQRLEIASRSNMAGHASMLRSHPIEPVTILCEAQ